MKKLTKLSAAMASSGEQGNGQRLMAKRKKVSRAISETSSRLRKRKPLDFVTVLMIAEPGKRACKKFSLSGGQRIVEGYDAGSSFIVLPPYPVSGIEDFSCLMHELEPVPIAFIVRGALVRPELIGTNVRRTGSGEGSQFKGNFRTPPQGRHYIEIDVDDYPLPRHLSLRKDAHAVCEYLIRQLPAEFWDVSYHYQLSSQAGMKGSNSARVHLWFWLDRRVPDRDLKAWANHVNSTKKHKLIDPALFQHVQVHYTAAPIFDGVPDPFPVRSALVVKRHGGVALDLTCLSKTPPPKSGTKPASSTLKTTPAGSGFEYHVSQIGDHPGGAGFRKPLLSATASYVSTHGRDGTDPAALYQTLHDAVIAADARDHTPSDVEDRASESVIMPMIASAMAKFGDAASHRSKSRRIDGAEPHYQVGTGDELEAKQALDKLLDQVF